MCKCGVALDMPGGRHTKESGHRVVAVPFIEAGTADGAVWLEQGAVCDKPCAGPQGGPSCCQERRAVLILFLSFVLCPQYCCIVGKKVFLHSISSRSGGLPSCKHVAPLLRLSQTWHVIDCMIWHVCIWLDGNLRFSTNIEWHSL